MLQFFKKKRDDDDQKPPSPYLKLLKKLHEKYPGKHIAITTDYKYFDHAGGHYNSEHSVYVEDEVSHQFFLTFSQVVKYVNYLCKKNVGV